jgi:hypothetical protein
MFVSKATASPPVFLICRFCSVAGALSRGTKLLASFQRSFTKIIRIVISATEDTRIVFCEKPLAAAANLASLHRSQPAFKGDENNRIYRLALRIEVFRYFWPFLP